MAMGNASQVPLLHPFNPDFLLQMLGLTCPFFECENPCCSIWHSRFVSVISNKKGKGGNLRLFLIRTL